jgi:hypothetical protein
MACGSLQHVMVVPTRQKVSKQYRRGKLPVSLFGHGLPGTRAGFGGRRFAFWQTHSDTDLCHQAGQALVHVQFERRTVVAADFAG